MNFVSAVIFLGMIAVLGIALWGLAAKPRSRVIGVIAATVALMAAGGAWYAWAESKSVPVDHRLRGGGLGLHGVGDAAVVWR